MLNLTHNNRLWWCFSTSIVTKWFCKIKSRIWGNCKCRWWDRCGIRTTFNNQFKSRKDSLIGRHRSKISSRWTLPIKTRISWLTNRTSKFGRLVNNSNFKMTFQFKLKLKDLWCQVVDRLWTSLHHKSRKNSKKVSLSPRNRLRRRRKSRERLRLSSGFKN